MYVASMDTISIVITMRIEMAVTISTIIPESITISPLLAHTEMYGYYHTINSARDIHTYVTSQAMYI